MKVMGIDEAGRGCVLGPLVVGSFVVDGVDDVTLRGAGADDSKAMSAARRLAARAALEPLGTPGWCWSPPHRSTRATSTTSKRSPSST